MDDDSVELVGVEAGGKGVDTGSHAARFYGGNVGIAQGYKTYFFQDSEGQMEHTHSVSAGLDYIGVSPILAHWHDSDAIAVQATLILMVVASGASTTSKEIGIDSGLLLASLLLIATCFKNASSLAEVLEKFSFGLSLNH